MRWEHTPIDLFFSYDALHDSCMERRRTVPFGEGETLQILSAESRTDSSPRDRICHGGVV